MGRQFRIGLFGELARAVDRVQGVDMDGHRSELRPEIGAPGVVEWGEQVCLGGLQAVIEGGQEPGALGGDDDSASSSIGGIGLTFDQPGPFEVIEEVGHDRPVDAQVVGQGQLATDLPMGGGGHHLVATRAAGKLGYCLIGGSHVSPEHHAERPAQILSQRVTAP